jgi:F420H(2)-dependent quinone reductase
MAAVTLSPMLTASWWVHRHLYRLSGGRIGRRLNGFEILLLTTTGRRSRAPRHVALQFLPHRGGWAVIGSRAGDARHPAWWLNLVARPSADVQVGSRRMRVRAREAEDAERSELWDRFVAIDGSYEEYARRAERRIPVVVLEPAAG